MFNRTEKLEQKLEEQKAITQELLSEIKALQTYIKFMTDDIEAIRRELREVKIMLPAAMEAQQPQHNWKVERL